MVLDLKQPHSRSVEYLRDKNQTDNLIFYGNFNHAHTHTHTIDLSLSFAILLTGNEIFFSFYQHYNIFAFGFDLCSFYFCCNAAELFALTKNCATGETIEYFIFNFNIKIPALAASRLK